MSPEWAPPRPVYRLYDEADLDRLHRRRSPYRELGFGLEDIAPRSSRDPRPGRSTCGASTPPRPRPDRPPDAPAPARSRRRWRHTCQASTSPPRRSSRSSGKTTTPTSYADEARDRWGDTDAYRQSAQRTASYTKDDWLRIKAEGEAITQRFADLFTAGAAADGAEAAAEVRDHREYISRWFYDCSPQMQRGLAEMYVADDRFRRTYDDRARAWPSGSTTRSSPSGLRLTALLSR